VISSRPDLIGLVKSAIGSFIAIAFVAWLAMLVAEPLLLGSLGASCVMLFAFPDLPFSQPRNVIGGHLLASLIGLACLHYLGTAWWVMPVALSLAIFLMVALGVVHPPAGSNPIIIFLGQSNWGFLIFPTLTGVVVIVLVALVYNNLTRKTSYPIYW
jgi:CBS-domain-containing membrane protein